MATAESRLNLAIKLATDDCGLSPDLIGTFTEIISVALKPLDAQGYFCWLDKFIKYAQLHEAHSNGGYDGYVDAFLKKNGINRSSQKLTVRA
ncbi:MAG TPA: hypothetical protein VLH19_05385 [Patescibacteria group bacterium]|nr:hypothetical protein [Patescibacteria group bacterium]